jgi:hypothetical protein
MGGAFILPMSGRLVTLDAFTANSRGCGGSDQYRMPRVSNLPPGSAFRVPQPAFSRRWTALAGACFAVPLPGSVSARPCAAGAESVGPRRELMWRHDDERLNPHGLNVQPIVD